MAPKDKPKSRSNPAKKGKARVQAEDSDTENARWLPNTNNYDVPETQRATYQLNQSLTGNDAFAKKISNGVTAWDKHQPPCHLLVDDVYKFNARTGQYLGFTCMEDYRYFVYSAGKS